MMHKIFDHRFPYSWIFIDFKNITRLGILGNLKEHLEGFMKTLILESDVFLNKDFHDESYKKMKEKNKQKNM